MIPAPGGQNSIPYFFAADSRKLKISLLPAIDCGRSVSAPFSPYHIRQHYHPCMRPGDAMALLTTIKWSQCILAGTAVLGSPQLINCNRAICALASCIATRSGFNFKFAWPRTSLPPFVLLMSDSSGLSRCEYRIFSASVNCREGPSTRRTSSSRESSLAYGGVREATSTLRAVGGSWVVARHLRGCRVDWRREGRR